MFWRLLLGSSLTLLLCLSALIWWMSRPSLSHTQWRFGDIISTNATPQTHTPTLKIMTYNIGFAGGIDGLTPSRLTRAESLNNLSHIIDTIATHAPDILTIQEIDLDANRSGYINQISEIATKAGYPYVAVAYTWDCRWVPYPTTLKLKTHFAKTTAANAVFSKYPIIGQHIIRFPKPKKNNWIYNLFYLDRVAQIVQIQYNSHVIDVVNLHLEAWNKTDRESQMNTVTSYLSHTKRPTIIAGDFNTTPHIASKKHQFSDDNRDDYRNDATLNTLLSHPNMIDTLATKTSQEERQFWTFPANSPSRRLDYIVVSTPDWTPITSHIIQPALGSDHLPVLTQLTPTFMTPSHERSTHDL